MLRVPSEGADTINWLIGTKDTLPSGELWFDREIRKKVVFPWTKNSEKECASILNFCESIYEKLTNS